MTKRKKETGGYFKDWMKQNPSGVKGVESISLRMAGMKDQNRFLRMFLSFKSTTIEGLCFSMRENIFFLKMFSFFFLFSTFFDNELIVLFDFAQLSKTRMGKNIITAIQLEMSSKNTANIVDRVVELL